MKKLLLYFIVLTHVFSIECKNIRVHKERKIHIPTAQEIQSDEHKLIDMINEVRKSHNLRPLLFWDALSNIARRHSVNMAENKVEFGHDGFDERAKDLKAYGKYVAFGENVAYSFNYPDPLSIAVEGWMDSKGHRDNILGDFNYTGIGIAYSSDGKCYLTQLFAKRK